MLRAIGATVVVITLAACPDSPPEGEPDAGGGPDGAGPATLTVTFAPDPGIPAALGGTFAVEVDRLELRLRDLRAIGDAAPGDPRTSRAELTLAWPEGQEPAARFPEAPPGFYSRLKASVAEYRVRGQVTRGAEVLPFEIEDEGSMVPVEVALAVEVRAGQVTEVPVLVAVGAFVDSIPWGSLPAEEGKLELHADDPELQAVRTALAGAFRCRDPGQCAGAVQP